MRSEPSDILFSWGRKINKMNWSRQQFNKLFSKSTASILNYELHLLASSTSDVRVLYEPIGDQYRAHSFHRVCALATMRDSNRCLVWDSTLYRVPKTNDAWATSNWMLQRFFSIFKTHLVNCGRKVVSLARTWTLSSAKPRHAPHTNTIIDCALFYEFISRPIFTNPTDQIKKIKQLFRLYSI